MINLIRNALRHNAADAEHIEVQVHLKRAEPVLISLILVQVWQNVIFLSYSSHF